MIIFQSSRNHISKFFYFYLIAISLNNGLYGQSFLYSFQDKSYIFNSNKSATIDKDFARFYPFEMQLDTSFLKFSFPPMSNVNIYLYKNDLTNGEVITINVDGKEVDKITSSNLDLPNRYVSKFYHLKNGSISLKIKNIVNAATFIKGIGYKNYNTEIDDRFDISSECHEDVNCVDKYTNVKHSVARVLITDLSNKEAGKINYCTGTLINSTSNNDDFLFITASHCLTNGSIESSDFRWWSFDFGYQKVCPKYSSYNKTPKDNYTYMGAEYLAHTSSDTANDILLLRLIDSRLKHNKYLVWAGWNAMDEVFSELSLIHHPEGDVKKLLLSNNPAILYTPKSKNNTEKSILKVIWNKGFTEFGSSGSGLLNSNFELLGVLSYGSSIYKCNSKNTDYFGALSYSFLYQNKPEHRKIVETLDPSNTNKKSLPPKYKLSNLSTKNQTNIIINYQKGRLFLKTNVTGMDEIKIYNLSGMQMISLPYTTEIDISQLPIGVYVLALLSKGKIISSKKFINTL